MLSQLNRSGTGLLILCALLTIAGCTGSSWRPGAPLANSTPQNWGAKQQIKWYRGSQGSRLIPQAWLAALEDANSTTMFMDQANFERFNYLPAAPGETVQLPIGFALDIQSDKRLPITRLRWFKGQGSKEPWVGLNCAACHTAGISYAGTNYRVDGAPSLADFQGFTDALRRSMTKTLADPAKWARFEARVVPRRSGGRNDARASSDRAKLKTAFAALLTHHDELATYNATENVYGHGRLDAVGHILNKVAFLNADPSPMRGEPDAPVSYPFIWNAGQQDFVQWNGLVPNNFNVSGVSLPAIGPLVRNTSEVIGVFADVKTRKGAGLKGYKSSVRVTNLHKLEKLLSRLMSPAWPNEFGIPKPVDVEAGRRLFETEFQPGVSCASCHKPLKRNDVTTKIKAQMSPIWGVNGVGTDPWMVCNTFTYQAEGGLLTGTKDTIFSGPPLPKTAPTTAYLKTQAVGVLLANKERVLWILAQDALGTEGEVVVDAAAVEKQRPRDQADHAVRLDACKRATAAPPDDDARRTLAYKARPLNGIWATAPYLHNGSVKSLYELLLPPSERDPEFWVGNREFDVRDVGFVDAKSAHGTPFRAERENGNSNAGHDYGNAILTEMQRRLLVEYMKSL